MDDSLKDAQVAKARELYMMFVKPSHISRDTGLTTFEISQLIQKWRPERENIYFGDDYVNDLDRSRLSVHQAAVLAVDEILESIKHKRQLKNKRGERVRMDMYESESMVNILLKLDKLVPVLRPLLNELEPPKDVSPDVATIDAKYSVVTSQKVLQAIKKDKSMLLMLKEAFNGKEHDGAQPVQTSESSERPGVHVRQVVGETLPDTQEQGDRGAAETGISDDLGDLSEREADRVLGSRVDESIESGPDTDRGSAGSSDERRAESTDESLERPAAVERVEAQGRQYSEPTDETAVRASRESRARESDPEPEFQDITDRQLSDPFEDEFA